MKDPYAVLVGLDWADQKHDVCWMETQTGQTGTLILEQSPEAINEWMNGLMAKHPGQRIAVCLEQSRGAVAHALMGYEVIDLYPLNPLTLARYREAFRPSGAKDDPSDAKFLLELLQRHPEALKVWKPDTEQTRLLRNLCEDRRHAVDMRKDLGNGLQSKLKEYFPQALTLVGDQMYSELCCAFLMKWPRFEAVAAARPDTLRRFYYACGSRSKELIDQRLDVIATSRPLCKDNAVVTSAVLWVHTLVTQIRALNRAIKTYDQQIKALFVDHPDHAIFASFPGAGPALAPRLLIAFGSDRSRFASASAAQTYIGVAPVVERSGKQMYTHWRWHCPTFVRQSLVEFACKSIGYCAWAKLYYEQQLNRGKKHHAAVRALAFKWVRIMFRCWQTNTPYNESIYVASLQKHGSWIAESIRNTP